MKTRDIWQKYEAFVVKNPHFGPESLQLLYSAVFVSTWLAVENVSAGCVGWQKIAQIRGGTPTYFPLLWGHILALTIYANSLYTSYLEVDR